ncbi:beta-ketoacyl-[acyl-carrier-protein] synthase family protein [Methylobacillus caricis]|uniref:beta-ketoacyl-[acyl-carrier-protein] synthase family protein n=1 Tax=Methylobacillus caricis TaxID=1971611 RepID=UPI001CFFD65F|nr:beta-ketoacyl-[acyl-carrier-protein] synthase family protein [Methylobacillus caricis]MCB5188045.1 beta-ketoacyl-[acyl-carrier-protein] synthase family protein [Methylobacillus caricis]
MSQRHYLSALGIINALGCGQQEVAQGLFQGDTSGMVLEEGWLTNTVARVGRACGELPPIPAHLSAFAGRNNQLLLAAALQIQQDIANAKKRYGPARIGIVLGSSTSGMAEGEAAVSQQQVHGQLPAGYQYLQQELGTPALFLNRYLELNGPAYTVSTACTSSAKAFQSARNLLRHNICDAVLVGGVDTLCKLTINGFTSLESTSAEVCQPMSLNRQGINIGEGAALFLLAKEPAPIELLGIGESSDAYHMSAPEPEGKGAEASMRAALLDAGLVPEAIGYLNLHATATRKNDEMESHAVARVFPAGVPCSGTKPLTGHTLGAAGATELAFCWLALQQRQLPPHIWDGIVDSNLSPLMLATQAQSFSGSSRRCMSNSFAFGGSNASLIIGDAQ